MVNVFQASRLALLDLLGRLGTDTRRWTYTVSMFLCIGFWAKPGVCSAGRRWAKKEKTRGKWRPLIKSFLPDIVIVPSPDVRLIVASSIEP